MLKNRLFNGLVAVVLVVLLALTAQDAYATARTISRSAHDAATTVCTSLPQNPSASARYVKETGAWVSYTQEGPAGVDGGLLYLLSNARSCDK